MTEPATNTQFREKVVVPLIFLVAGLVVLWIFDVSRSFECRRAEQQCYLDESRFLGIKNARTAIRAADIRNVFSRKHAQEQGWTYRLYITTQDGLAIGTEISVNENEAVIEASRAKLAGFLADPNAPDVAMKDAPNRLSRYAGLATLAFAAALFVSARRKYRG